MNWLNIHTPILRAPEYIGSEPVARATWLNVLAYCCEQENGGRIIGAAMWKDRQWQQTCGVTAQEVKDASLLLTIDGDDILVWRYPDEKESEVQRMRALGRVTSEKKREAARKNGSLGGRTQQETQQETQRQNPTEPNEKNPTEPIEGKGREGNGIEEKGIVRAPRLKLTDDEWIASLQANEGYRHLNVAAELGKARAWILTRPGRTLTQRFFLGWLNRASADARTITTHANTGTTHPVSPANNNANRSAVADYRAHSEKLALGVRNAGQGDRGGAAQAH